VFYEALRKVQVLEMRHIGRELGGLLDVVEVVKMGGNWREGDCGERQLRVDGRFEMLIE